MASGRFRGGCEEVESAMMGGEGVLGLIWTGRWGESRFSGSVR